MQRMCSRNGTVGSEKLGSNHLETGEVSRARYAAHRASLSFLGIATTVASEAVGDCIVARGAGVVC